MSGGSRERETVGAGVEGFEYVADIGDIAEGELAQVILSSGAKVCLFKHGGTVGAVDDTCTHAEFSMSEGVLHNDCTIECVWHGARFDCRTGAVRRGPAYDPLPVYEVRMDGERVLVGRRKS